MAIVLFTVPCFAMSVRAEQAASNEVMPNSVSFYQQQLNKLSYSLQKDGSFEKVSSKEVRPWLYKIKKHEDDVRKPPSTQMDVADTDAMILDRLAPSTHRSVETVDSAKTLSSRRSMKQATDEVSLSAVILNHLPLLQKPRKDPYVIVAEAKANHRSSQSVVSLRPMRLLEKAGKINPGRVQASLQQHFVTVRERARVTVDENFEGLRAQLERRFLIEGLSFSDLPAAVVSQIEGHADRTKVTIKEKTRSFLKQIEGHMGRAAEALR